MPSKNPWVLPDGFDENVKKAIAEIRAAFANAKKSIPKQALEALRQGNYEAFLAMIDLEEANAGFSGLQKLLQNVAAKSAVDVFRKAGAGAKLTFDIIDEYSVNWASTHTGNLIKGITEEMRLNVTRTITEATMGDLTWQQAAEQIGEYIPLTERDAKAVVKYHDRMLKKYIDRKGWKEKEARKYAKSLTDAYTEKLTQSRARTIARTEIANAATQGEFIGWEAGIESGQIDSDSQKEWIAEPNACEYCGSVDGTSVRWDANFPILGGKLLPPAHPNCRCAVALLPPDYLDTPFTAQAFQKSNGWWNQFEIEFAKHLAGKHDQSSHGKGGTGITAGPKEELKIPAHPDVNVNNSVSATFPYVGLSDKAQQGAKAISDVKTTKNNPPSNFVNIDNSPETVHTATYTDRDGVEHYMKIYEGPSADGTGVSGAVITFDSREALEAAGSSSATMIVYEKGFEGYLQYGADFRNPILIGGDKNASKIYKAQSGGKGVATAMLEFARSQSPMPILHTNSLTEDGAEFARTTKSVSALTKAIIDYQLAKADSYKPTQGMVTAAKRALRWKKEGKATGAGTPVGWGRATDIASGRSMSLSVVKRMYSFFSRHEVDKKGKDFDNISNPSNGRIMWDAWGGDSGFTWSKAIVEREKKLQKHLQGQHDQSTHGRGGASHSTDRPYELKSRRNDPDYNPDAYAPDASKGHGPMRSILGGGGTGTAKSRFEYELAVRTQIENGAAIDTVRQDVLKNITQDPDYPRIPEEFYGKDKSYSWQANPDTDAIKYWAKQDPEGAAAYLEKENKFVSDKIRAMAFPNGQTVGEITDGVAQSLLDQMQEIANNNTVSLTMPASKLKRFIDEDHYRTASETTLSGKGSNRATYMEARDAFEYDKMGIPKTKDSERPVYGVIGKQGTTYGDSQVIFKDDVKHRSTATVGDSLDGNLQGVHWLQDYADGNVSVDDLWDTHGQMLIGTLGNNNRSGSTFEWNRDSRGEAEWGGIKGYSGKADLFEMAEYNYVETQIHGGLKLADVAQIVIPSATSLSKATQAMLADKGIEVIVGSHLEKSFDA